MSKVYIWNNGNSESDFQPDENVNMGDVQSYSSDAHSGGIVVIADSLEEAVEFAIAKLNDGGKYNPDERKNARKYLLSTNPKVIDSDIKGLVLYASGDC